MRLLTLSMLMTLIIISHSQLASAQQARRPITIVFRQAPVAKTQWSGDESVSTATPDGTASSEHRSATATPPGELPDEPQHSQSAITGASQQAMAGNSSRPTLQQLQNPSGGYLLTHSNYSQGQYTSANNYNGSQFNSWNNLRQQPENLDLFQSFNRTQPPTAWGGYASPNTYIGPANNQWSNLSTGYITPNVMGGWTYQN